MTTDKELLKLERLKELLSYDENTGDFRWIKSNSNRSPVGRIAGGRLNNHGYAHINVDGNLYSAHRLAWFFMHGNWPEQIDHINGKRSDNKISNLRNVPWAINAQNKQQAQKNNKARLLGVVTKPNGKFQAEIRVNGKKIYLGTFSNAIDAHEVYKAAKVKYHEGYRTAIVRAAAEIGKGMK